MGESRTDCVVGVAATAAQDQEPCLCLLHAYLTLRCLRPLGIAKASVYNPALPPCLAVQFLRRLAPPNEPYLHNDLQYREVRACCSCLLALRLPLGLLP